MEFLKSIKISEYLHFIILGEKMIGIKYLMLSKIIEKDCIQKIRV